MWGYLCSGRKERCMGAGNSVMIPSSVFLIVPRKGEIPEISDPARIRHFKVHVDEPTLESLRSKLSLTRLPDQIANEEWEYGTELG
jgi:hypothetical protein